MAPKNVTPIVLWAQRKGELYLTIEAYEVKDVQISLDDVKLSFSGYNEAKNTEYSVELPFFKPVDPKVLLHHLAFELTLRRNQRNFSLTDKLLLLLKSKRKGLTGPDC